MVWPLVVFESRDPSRLILPQILPPIARHFTKLMSFLINRLCAFKKMRKICLRCIFV
jgi:hypothetical protein